MGPRQTNQALADAPVDDRFTDLRVGVSVRIENRSNAAAIRSWDRLVARTPGTDVAQLSAWADVRRRAGYEATFLMARAGDEVVGGAVVLQRRLIPGLRPVAYLPLGPVVPPGAYRDEAVGGICDALAELARHRFSALFVQPLAGDQEISDRLLRRGFRRSTAAIAPAASIAVDLAEPDAGLRSGTRASIRRAAREGVRVRRAGVADLPVVAGLLAGTAEHHGFAAASPAHLRELHDALAPGGHLQIFLAERDGTPLAADVLTGSGGVLTLRLTGMRRDRDTRRVGAAALLRWETMRWARAHGYTTLDLGGVPPAAVEALLSGHADLAARVDGPTYFKASFGGRAFHRPAAVEMLSPAVRLGYDLVRRFPRGEQLLRTAKQFLRNPGRR